MWLQLARSSFLFNTKLLGETEVPEGSEGNGYSKWKILLCRLCRKSFKNMFTSVYFKIGFKTPWNYLFTNTIFNIRFEMIIYLSENIFWFSNVKRELIERKSLKNVCLEHPISYEKSIMWQNLTTKLKKLSSRTINEERRWKCLVLEE